MSALLFIIALLITNLVCYAASFLSGTWLLAPLLFDIPEQPWQVHVLKGVMFVVIQIICGKVSRSSLLALAPLKKEQ